MEHTIFSYPQLGFNNHYLTYIIDNHIHLEPKNYPIEVLPFSAIFPKTLFSLFSSTMTD